MSEIDPARPKIERLPEVMARTGLKRSTLFSLIQRREFPQPIPLGGRAVGYLASEVDAWIEGKARSRHLNS